MEFKFKILHINKDERWILVGSNDESDTAEPAAFIELVRAIRADVDGKVEPAENSQFKITGDGLGLIYEWDALFGIIVSYPEDITETAAAEFLNKYMSEF